MHAYVEARLGYVNASFASGSDVLLEVELTAFAAEEDDLHPQPSMPRATRLLQITRWVCGQR